MVDRGPCGREDGGMDRYRLILVPIDFSEHSREAVRHAKGFAEHFGSTLELLHVVDHRYVQLGYGHAVMPVEENSAHLRQIAEERLEAFRQEMGLADGVVRRVRMGVPYDEILRRAGEGDVDLVVMGTHGHTGLERMMLGSQSESVVRRCPVPVLVVHLRKKKAE